MTTGAALQQTELEVWHDLCIVRTHYLCTVRA
jgi:hypothetical protein